MASQEPDLDGNVRMGYEGENLSALLYWMQENEPKRLNKIVSDMKNVIPKFNGITFNFVGADRIGFSLCFDDARQNVLAPNASSGTLLLLGLVTLLNSPALPDVACIEEPETGLTPDAVRLFFKLLTEATVAIPGKSGSQFLFSSHSPFVLVDAWNAPAKDRSFIKRLHVSSGRSVIEDVESIINRNDSGLVVKSDGSISLKAAEELMCGRFLPGT